MQRLVLQSVLAAASALFILSATACDKGAEKKADVKKAPEKEEVIEPADTAAAGTTTTTTTGAIEPVEPAGDTAGETGAGETGAGETGGAAPAADTGKEPDVKEPDTKEPDTKKTEPVAAKIDAKSIFEGKCKSCHGADGKGDTTIGKKVDIPSLSGTKLSKSDTVKKITDGVPDTKMKGYADKLSKEEIDAVAAYVKKL